MEFRLDVPAEDGAVQSLFCAPAHVYYYNAERNIIKVGFYQADLDRVDTVFSDRWREMYT